MTGPSAFRHVDPNETANAIAMQAIVDANRAQRAAERAAASALDFVPALPWIRELDLKQHRAMLDAMDLALLDRRIARRRVVVAVAAVVAVVLAVLLVLFGAGPRGVLPVPSPSSVVVAPWAGAPWWSTAPTCGAVPLKNCSVQLPTK